MEEVIKFNMEATDFQIDSLSLFWHNYIKLFKDCTQPASDLPFRNMQEKHHNSQQLLFQGPIPKFYMHWYNPTDVRRLYLE